MSEQQRHQESSYAELMPNLNTLVELDEIYNHQEIISKAIFIAIQNHILLLSSQTNS